MNILLSLPVCFSPAPNNNASMSTIHGMTRAGTTHPSAASLFCSCLLSPAPFFITCIVLPLVTFPREEEAGEDQEVWRVGRQLASRQTTHPLGHIQSKVSLQT